MPAPDPHRIITQLDLSVRTYWRLYKAALFTVAKIVERAPEELLELFGERGCVEELRDALRRAGYDDPWPELDSVELVPSPPVRVLGLRADIEAALLRGRLRTVARVLGTPPDDLLSLLTWEQYDELRRRLIELGHAEPGNIDSG
ncbi:MAG TPA: hypothetical protein VNN10_16025 [Dehalococcoidia bacterium]|nr:hypothetical protein [Dehalococcoidia bacterium]